MNAVAKAGYKPRGLKLVVGDGSAKRGASMAMAMRINAHARELGCNVRPVKHSRVRRSNAVYLSIICPAKRLWSIRIADHQRPDRAAVPNIDLVSRDGVRGEPWLRDCVAALAVGFMDWFDSAATARPPTPKELKFITKSKNKFGIDLALVEGMQ
jgi:hypothetical protein